MLTTLVSSIVFIAAAVAQVPQSQVPIVYNSIHNATPIVGTWASGAKNVQTGSGFADPENQNFTYPSTTGISYSFDDDGNYEIARYRFTSNGELGLPYVAPP